MALSISSSSSTGSSVKIFGTWDDGPTPKCCQFESTVKRKERETEMVSDANFYHSARRNIFKTTALTLF
jgi:hypothetical protein